AEYLRAARAVVESESGKHSAGSISRCETLSPPPASIDLHSSPPPRAHPRAACDCCPAVRTRAPAARAATWAAAPAEYRLLHPGKASRDPPAQTARFSD